MSVFMLTVPRTTTASTAHCRAARAPVRMTASGRLRGHRQTFRSLGAPGCEFCPAHCRTGAERVRLATVGCMESTGLGDDVEKWLASGTDVRRLAVPAQTVNVPGLGPLLVIAVLGWPDSIPVLTVEPGLGAPAKTSNARLALRDDLGGVHPFRQGGGGGGGPVRPLAFQSPVGDSLPEGARALHLYGLPAKSALTHTADEPLPPHVTISLD